MSAVHRLSSNGAHAGGLLLLLPLTRDAPSAVQAGARLLLVFEGPVLSRTGRCIKTPFQLPFKPTTLLADVLWG